MGFTRRVAASLAVPGALLGMLVLAGPSNGQITAGSAKARANAEQPTKIVEIGNVGGVQNGPTASSIFRTTRAWHVVQIVTYHWNDAKGTTPGRIGLIDLTSKKRYGPYKAGGSPGQGGVPNAYWIAKVSFDLPVGRYQVTDSDPETWAQNDESGGRGFFYLMGTPAVDAWPPLPDALVPLASVSNGCGGGTASTDPRWGDTSTYLNDNNPLGTRYPVNFREACNLHDAGYSGAKVRDPLHGDAITDFYTWTQEQVDNKFLADMRMLCDQQIPSTAPVAQADCKARGGKTSLGAESRYNAVRAIGHKFWRLRPRIADVWVDQSDPEAPVLAVTQTLRNVRATWRGDKDHPGLRGEFRGTVISRDQDSIVKGWAKVIYQGKTTLRAMHIVVDPDTPNRIEVGGPGIAGSKVRG